MQESEYNEVIKTIRNIIKTIVGIFLVIISSITLYTMCYFAEWWASHINNTFIGLCVIITLLLLGVGVILICDRFNHQV